MKRAALLAILAACKGGAAKPDARPDDCVAPGRNLAAELHKGAILLHADAATKAYLTAHDAELDAELARACREDGWSGETKRCLAEAMMGLGMDRCDAMLGPYAVVAATARFNSFVAQARTPPVTDCEHAATVLATARTLRVAKAAPAGADAAPYTRLLGALKAAAFESCAAWSAETRACIVAARLPGELDAVDACLAAMPEADRAALTAKLAALEGGVTGPDCAAVGAKMRGLIKAGPDAVPGFLDTLAPAVEQMFLGACRDDGWPDDVKQCVLDLPPDQGADPCFQKLAPYAMVAMGARLQELPSPTTPPPSCEDAGRALAMTWVLEEAAKAPAGASPRVYTTAFGAIGDELGEMCAERWPGDVVKCLVDKKLPEDRATIDAGCLATLSADAAREVEAFRKTSRTELLTMTAPGTATGGDDCAAVGDAMVQIWTLKAQQSMAKHPEAAQWDLDHLEDLRQLVIAACLEDRWPADVRTCVTGLKLPNEAPAFEDCINALPPASMEALGKRTAALEAVRDQAIGATPRANPAQPR